MSDAVPPPDSSADSAAVAALDALVDEWTNLPDIAEAIGTDVKQVRKMVADRRVVGVRRGERGVFQVPAAFLVDGTDGTEVLPALRGTVMVLSDVGMSDVEILRWLFEPEESIGVAPVVALRSGRTHEVRRVAQALA